MSARQGFNVGTPINPNELSFAPDESLDRKRRNAFLHLQKTVDCLTELEGWRNASLIWQKDREIDHMDAIPINSMLSKASNLDDPIIAVVPSSKRIDFKKLSRHLDDGSNDERINSAKVLSSLVPVEDVEEACGFPPLSVPPFGHRPNNLRVIIDVSLYREGLILLGGGGHPKIACWISAKTLLKIEGTELADIVVNDDAEENAETNGLISAGNSQNFPKPYFQIAPPGIDEAREVLEQSIPNTLKPQPLTLVGRISGLRRMARRLVFCDFAPIDFKGSGTKLDAYELPWRSAADGEDMAVQLIAGKTFCRNRGDTVGTEALRRLKVGRLVMVEGKTNVGNRESLGNWVKKRSLDIVVFDFCILEEKEASSSFSPQIQPSPKISKPRPHVKKWDPNLDYLKLSDVFQTNGDASVKLVDSFDGLDHFERSLGEISSGIEDDSRPALVGVDCEWKPLFMFETSLEEGYHPVLLLQVSLYEVREIYLFDLQTLLRACLHPTASMNEIETCTSKLLERMFASERLAKVGFQLATDLQRLAGSYPHVTAFRGINNVIETSAIARRFIRSNNQDGHLSKQVTSSLSKLAEYVLGKPMNKEQQCSDWSIRPLSQSQLDYAALDAAVTPCILLNLLDLASIDWVNNFKIGRNENDETLSNVISSFRFVFIESSDDAVLKKLTASRVVSDENMVTQWWKTGTAPPKLPMAPNGDGPYIDAKGMMFVPALSIKLSRNPKKDNSRVLAMLGAPVGLSKESCLVALLEGNTDLPAEATLEFNKKSGYVELSDSIVFFVNMPERYGEESFKRTYWNTWLDEGKVLTWFFRDEEWKGGTTRIAQKLPKIGTCSQREQPPRVLFVRVGRGHFICCGTVEVSFTDRPTIVNRGNGNQDLVEVKLHLLLWEKLQLSPDFVDMTRPRKVERL